MIRVRRPARRQNQVYIQQPIANGKSSSAREIISASGFDVTLSIRSLQIFFAAVSISFIETRLVINQMERASLLR